MPGLMLNNCPAASAVVVEPVTNSYPAENQYDTLGVCICTLDCVVMHLQQSTAAYLLLLLRRLVPWYIATACTRMAG